MKSLELNWIRKKVDRTIPMPEVMYFPFTDAGGRYYRPQKGWMFDGDMRPHSMKYGVIVVSPLCSDNVEATIAHEWRHHWQYFHGVKFDATPVNIFQTMAYEKALVKYFKSSRMEMDALRFQYKHSTIHEAWEELLFNFIKDLHTTPIITYGNNPINS